MCRNDRGWHRLSPALTEAEKVSGLKNNKRWWSVRWLENQISQAVSMMNDKRNGNRKICGR
nr:MAG TPA: hypothetical protein [Caudoviricetes sp.]